MSENGAEKKTAKTQRTAVALRKQLGGAPHEVLKRNKEQNRLRRTIVDAMRQGSATVPEIAETTKLPSHQVLWHLMAMKKYGEVVEGDQQGDYFKYVLVQKQEKAK
ncbi:MAG: hypothetical protein KAS72_03000 [Phycisphaerales bacterium]|nr:hypothetical protein [Phycisphaerales bacterium]